MNMTRKTIFFLTLILIIPFFGFAQKKAMKKAEAAYIAGEYTLAAQRYEEIIAKATDKQLITEISFKLGECYRKTNNPKGARKWYKKSIAGKINNPLAYLYYADALKMLDLYEEARLAYTEYATLVPADSRGTNGAKSCQDAQDWIANPTRHIIEEVKEINSKVMDYSPAFGASTSEVYFSSTRESTTGTTTDKISGEQFSDIFLIKKDRKGKWSEAVPVQGGINSDYDEGSPCVINGGSVMYYTACKPGNSTGRCKIYKSRQTSSEWGASEEVVLFTDSSISVAHPAVSKDELTMYFVCDTMGGFGGKDIWVTKRASASAKWNKPENMGLSINTKGDEVFPFIRDNGELYFASNGHPGMGGLDIFKAVLTDKGCEVSNLQTPMNTSKDDFGICFYESEYTGCFTSSRGKSDDIYFFELPELVFSLKGVVKNSKTAEPVEGALVEIVGSDGSKREITSSSDGTFRFTLKKSTSYTIVSGKEKFLKTQLEETTAGLRESRDFEVVLEIIPALGDIELPNIEYDLGKKELRPESTVSLDKLVNHLNVNSNITIELSANTDYRGSDESNNKLSQGRAESVVKYLIEKGIKNDRLTPIGYGETKPKVVNKEIAGKYEFLKEGDAIDDFIDDFEITATYALAFDLFERFSCDVAFDEFGDKNIFERVNLLFA